jgi:hypothetical protein
VCVAVAAAALSAPPAVAAEWAPRQVVSDLGDNETALFPQAVMARNGEAVVAWTQLRFRGSRTLPSTQRVYVAERRAGRRFGDARAVTERGATLVDLRVARDGTVALLYQVDANDDGDCGRDCPNPVRLRVRRPGERFGAPEDVTGAGVYPALGVSADGSFEVVYVSARTRVVTRRRLSPGRFTAPRALSPKNSSRVVFATNDAGAAVVAWLRDPEAIAGALQVRQRAAGAGFGPVEDIDTDGQAVEPAVAVGAGGHAAVAAQSASRIPPVTYLSYRPPGASGPAIERIEDSGLSRVAVDPVGDTLLTIGRQRCYSGCGATPDNPAAGTGGSETLVSIRSAGGVWGPMQPIGGGFTGFDAGFDARGTAIALVTGFSGPVAVLERPAGGALAPAVELAPEPGQSGGLGVNRRGQAVAAWTQGTRPTRIEASVRTP